MTIREGIYALLVGVGVLLPTYFNVQAMGDPGANLLIEFFTLPLANPITSSLLFDLLLAFAAFNVFLFSERRTIGNRSFGLCLAVSWLVAFAAGLPLFLLLRERSMRNA
jgi:Protein of unknown function DUF2834